MHKNAPCKTLCGGWRVHSLCPGDGVGVLDQQMIKLMACCLTTPSHYLKQFSLATNEILWHSFKDMFTWNTQDINPQAEITHLKSQSNLTGYNELIHYPNYTYTTSAPVDTNHSMGHVGW